MNRIEVVRLVKTFCADKQFRYIDDIGFGKRVLILISGENCVNEFDQYLNDIGLEHTTPALIADGIGSYINIQP